MGLFTKEIDEKPPPLGGGPLGLGDPDDKRLRKTEKDLIITKMMREEAAKRCQSKLDIFLQCAKENGFFFFLKCQEENLANNKCMNDYINNPEFVNEMTERYLHARSHYRRTGQPLEKYDRKKKSSTGFC